MNFHILTLFPEMVLNGLHTSITGRALENGQITVEAVNPIYSNVIVLSIVSVLEVFCSNESE